jgi:chromosome segregation ATPase
VNQEHQATQAVEAAARRRRELRDALVALEDAVASSVHDSEHWRRRVAERLEALREAFAEHVAETEAIGGLYDEMEEIAPHVQGKARRLREEHPPLSSAIADAAARFDAPFAETTDLDALRDDLQRLMGRFIRHRQHGADLVWEAYQLDIGGAG